MTRTLAKGCATSGAERTPRAPAILILSLVFPPDSVSTAQIMGELAVELRARGSEVTVVTTTPHYNLEAQALAAQPLRNWWGRLVQQSNFHGVRVYHALMPRKSGRVVARVLAWIGFHVLSLLVGSLGGLRWQVIVAPSPPLTIGVCAWLLTLRRRSRYVYNVQEIYPDIAIALGALRNPLAIEALSAVERFVYRRAAAITVIAPRMRDRLLQKGVPSDKVRIIANCTDADTLRPLPRDNAFARKHGLIGRFVVSYAGNMGPAQGLDTLLDAAALLRSRDDIRFVLVGDGILRSVLVNRVAHENLENVLMLPQQPYSLMPEIYSASDVSVVAQASASGSDAVPSKVYRIMTCGRPVLAITDLGSDLARLVHEAGGGWVVQAGDIRALSDTIERASQNRQQGEALGRAGRDHVLAHYTRRAMGDAYFDLLSGIAPRRDGG